MNPIRAWWNIATIVTAALGVALALSGVAPRALGAVALLDALFPGATPASDAPPELLTLLLGVSGGIMAGFGVACRAWLLAEPRRAILAGLLAWFVVDSALSVWSGATFNVLGNLGFLALTLPPVLLWGRLGEREELPSRAVRSP